MRVIARFKKALICVLAASMMLGNTPVTVSAYAAIQETEDLRHALAAMNAQTSRLNDSASIARAVDGGQDAAAGDASDNAIAFQPGGGISPQTNPVTEGSDKEESASVETSGREDGVANDPPPETAAASTASSGDADAAAGAADPSAGAAAVPADQAAPAATRADAADQALDSLGGRDFSGQATKTINGRTYILIGNEQQLRAIGSGKKVTSGTVYKVEQTLTNAGSVLLPKLEWVDSGEEQVAYAGDADLSAGTALHDADFSDHDGGGIIVGDKRTKYFVKDASGNRHDVTDDTYGPNTGLTYSADASYIIFRNIDVSSDAASDTETGATWTPLMFSGTMLGDVSGAPETAGSLWGGIGADGVSTNDTAERPVISNVKVRQTGKLDITKYTGIGFFGTVTNKLDADDPIQGELTPTYISNIALKDADVSNESTEVHVDETVISGLVSGIGKLLDATVVALLAPLLKLLGLGSVTDLIHTLLTGVLDIRKADPSSLATGIFAGRIVGQVTVTDCDVQGGTVSSAAPMTGGFAGYVQGETRYSLVSKLAGGLVTVLEKILNVIPGLGLGDLITLLLDGGILKLDNLIPVGYANARITASGVSGFTEGVTIGTDGNAYSGGFAGTLIGTIVQDCYVTSANAYTVKAESYAGGFVGIMRNDEMKGALSELGVDLPSLAIPQSAVTGAALTSDATVTAGAYAGGFAGAMANSYAVNVSLRGTISVSATGLTVESGDSGSKEVVAPAGGFTSVATVGWYADLGAGEKKESSVLSSLSDVLTSVLGDPSKAQSVLSLMGLSESQILGASMEGDISVTSANDYAGGIVGKGVGTVIADSDAAHVNALSFWKHKKLTWDDASTRSTTVTGLDTVVANRDYAGGIAGDLKPAAIASLLNDTLGLGEIAQKLGDGSYTKMFEVSNLTLAGADGGATVSAKGYYAGGAIGFATGGDISNVRVSGLKAVSATGEAGGFIGFSGPGSAVNSGGLNLLGLIKISGLLTVATYSAVTVSSSSVAGVASGMTVSATGEGEGNETAGGFFGQANSTKALDAHARNLKVVSAEMTSGATAGGFVGTSTTGGLVSTLSDTDDGTKVLDALIEGGLIKVSDLLGAIPYLVPSYKNATVSFVNGGSVSGDIAGGFAGDFQSGKVNIFSDDDLKDDAAAAAKQAVADAPWGVCNVAAVTGGAYAGGWGGRVTAGALAQAGKGGITLLGKLGAVDAAQLLSAVQLYVPLINRSGVKSDAATTETTSGAALPDPANPGLVVSASRVDDTDAHSGSAGGFIGYGAAVQVSRSNVTQLRHTSVTEPAKLEGVDGASYFDTAKSAYAVTAPRAAGGYIGHMNVGSAASVGDGLSLLGESLTLTDVLGLVEAVVSTIEHSDVTGGTGGFAVCASDATGGAGHEIGDAGGFAGLVTGGHVQDSNSYNFSYVIGQVSAGGYAGQIKPGSVAEVLGSLNDGEKDTVLGKLLRGLVNTGGSLASLIEDFVPTIRNSETTCIPCGGAVRAQAASTASAQRGMAGGYVGHNNGGHIWGVSNAPWVSAAAWESQNDASNHYDGQKRAAMAERIRSVYGAEIAGGFTGFMEPADTASGGSIEVLFGLIKVGSLLGALQVAYPTEENTQVTGPVRGITVDTWNGWSQHVAAKGYYGGEFAGKTFASQDELDAFLAAYVYGTNVVAGRASYENSANVMHGGVAGGYVGLMRGGTVTNGQAFDTKTVSAMRAAGGFAGRMEAGGAVELGGVEVLGLNLNLGQLLNVAQVLVPVVKSSGVTGFRTGMTVKATGTDLTHELGFAGGFVGFGSGAQLWGDAAFADADKSDDRWTIGATHEGYTATGLNVANLRRVSGANCVGGFAGMLTAGGVADVNTNASSGLLQAILNKIIEAPSDLLQVLNATVGTVRGAHVSAVTVDAGLADVSADAAKANVDAVAWGFTVDGSYKDGDAVKYARAAGGFAGSMRAVVAGTKDRKADEGDTATSTLTVAGLRGVEGGQYAGGFFGQADIESVASVGGSAEDDQSTKLLLNILKLGNVSVLDAFRTYVYHGGVAGVADGFQVRAHDSSTQGMLDSTRYTGVAGGFGGALINGSVKDCAVTGLSAVQGINYTGGFIGHLGRAGTVDADKVGTAANLLGATAGVLDIWGSHVEDSSVQGIAAGYTVTSAHSGADYVPGASDHSGEEVAGGFAGYADLARVKGCTAVNLKKVASGEVAGGFVGENGSAKLVDLEVSSALLDGLLKIVDFLLKLLYAGDLEDLGVINLGEWFGIGKVFDLKVLADGELLYVNLFGLKIGVSLDQRSKDDPSQTDVAKITIGDSVISLPVSNGSVDTEGNRANLKVALIQGNRTRVEDSSVTGISVGYDVFGGGASQTQDGTEGLATGFAAGFAGRNNRGVLAGDAMVLADTIRGTVGKVDPFAVSIFDSTYWFNSMDKLVGPTADGRVNSYRIYREAAEGLGEMTTSNTTDGSTQRVSAAVTDDVTGLDRFTVGLYEPVNAYDADVAKSGASGDDETTWVGIKGALRTGSAGSRALDAYVSASKAVLMLDTAVDGNAGGLTPEPGEGQDPCDTYADLTLVKVWNDLADKDGKRPESVTFTITATYTDAAGAVQTPGAIVRRNADGTTHQVANPLEVTLETGDAQAWSDTWRKVVEGLPVAFDDNGTTRYYTYSVTEKDVPAGYTAQASFTANDFTATVTNTHRDPLPETGGAGITVLLALAGVIVAGGTAWAYERRRRSLKR